MPESVVPGQNISAIVSYTVLGGNPNAVVYKTVLADWQPNTPIATLEKGVLQGSPRTIKKSFSFTAPIVPGRYRMRLAMTWAFRGIQSFYGDGPAGDSWKTGVGPYCEVEFSVEK